MSIIKNWKIHFIVLILAIICEWIGTKKIAVGPGVLLFLPMLYAMVIGTIVSLPKFKVFKETETSHATVVLGLMTILKNIYSNVLNSVVGIRKTQSLKRAVFINLLVRIRFTKMEAIVLTEK